LPVEEAVQISEPSSVDPFAMLELTVKEGWEAPFETVTVLVALAVRPSVAYAVTASV
jgi:hypothetical protein